MTNLASATYGASMLFATYEWFSPASRLLLPESPVFIAYRFTNFGKWMDGWESRRKRTPGHDCCILALGMRGAVDVMDVDTAFFMGNYPHNYDADAEIEFQGLTASATRDRKMGTNATSKEIKLVERLKSLEWTEIISVTKLGAGWIP
ncbi:hypothetical protein PsorP6_001109 [Peronosclerospora sorghi]|uniref:Uncharacterized protein n=1 Tax=Peronosclerospora sorghi TaxID=230839 RepID=A0ACC0WS45_9STRA|nr:hypothetical protein PsorP6_001109 [Peronosclerospora sorghi]